MKQKTLSLFRVSLLACGPLLAQNLDTVLPDPVPKQVEPVKEAARPSVGKALQEAYEADGIFMGAREGEEILVGRLRKVRVVGDEALAIPKPAPDAGPLEVAGVPLMGIEAAEVLFGPFLDRPVSRESLERMQQVVRLYFAQLNRPFSLVYVPPQDITEGEVRLVVRESVVGQVRVEGNSAFSDRSYLSRIGVAPGTPLDSKRIRDGLDRINLNPFREAAAEFAKGKEPGTADLRIRANDRTPWRLHGGFNNGGSQSTTEERVSAGIDWGNAFGAGHLATLQWTSDMDAEHSRAVSGNYLADLPGGRSLTAFGAYSEIEGKTGPEFDQSGKSWQLGANLEWPLGDAPGRWTLGVDFKYSDNNLDFIQPPFIIPITDNTTHVVQARAGYRGSVADAWGSTAYGLRLTLSPGGLGDKNEREPFELARAGADPRYVIGHLDLHRETRLPRDFSWSVQVDGQLASANLLGSETLAGGGMHSVRGYEEGEVYGDNGFVLRQEFQWPMLRPAFRASGGLRQDALRLFLFQDAATLWNTDPLEGEERIDLASGGVGLTYQYGRNLTLRVAHGWQFLESGSGDSGDDARTHFHLNVGF